MTPRETQLKDIRGEKKRGWFKKGHPSYTKSGPESSRYKHGQFGTPLYRKWCGMKRRCFNVRDKRYKDYGGRGITVSKEWMEFVNFARDMGSTFQQGLSLERVDNDGNYEKENCRWVPLIEQQRNKRTVTLYDYRGRKVSLGQLEGELELPKGLLRYRVKKLGWNLMRAVETPLVKAKRSPLSTH